MKTLGEELLTRTDEKDLVHTFSKSESFIQALLLPLKTFWDCHNGTHRDEDGNAFTSHKSYELALFYLVALLETKTTMKATIETMMKVSNFNDYVNVLAEHLVNDISYHTQVCFLSIVYTSIFSMRHPHPYFYHLYIGNQFGSTLSHFNVFTKELCERERLLHAQDAKVHPSSPRRSRHWSLGYSQIAAAIHLSYQRVVESEHQECARELHQSVLRESSE